MSRHLTSPPPTRTRPHLMPHQGARGHQRGPPIFPPLLACTRTPGMDMSADDLVFLVGMLHLS